MAMATMNERMVQVERTGRETKHPVRVTALAYLSGALANEQYEECMSLLSIAREFGATEAEVHETLMGASRALEGTDEFRSPNRVYIH